MARTLWRVVPAVALLAAMAAPGYATGGVPIHFDATLGEGAWNAGAAAWSGSILGSNTHAGFVGGSYDLTITGDWDGGGGYWEFVGNATLTLSGGGDSLVGTSEIAIQVFGDDLFGYDGMVLLGSPGNDGVITGGSMGGTPVATGSYFVVPMVVQVGGIDGNDTPQLGVLPDQFAVVEGDYIPTPELPPGVLAFIGGPGLLWWRTRRRRTKS